MDRKPVWCGVLFRYTHTVIGVGPVQSAWDPIIYRKATAATTLVARFDTPLCGRNAPFVVVRGQKKAWSRLICILSRTLSMFTRRRALWWGSQVEEVMVIIQGVALSRRGQLTTCRGQNTAQKTTQQPGVITIPDIYCPLDLDTFSRFVYMIIDWCRTPSNSPPLFFSRIGTIGKAPDV